MIEPSECAVLILFPVQDFEIGRREFVSNGWCSVYVGCAAPVPSGLLEGRRPRGFDS